MMSASIVPLLEEHHYGHWPLHAKRYAFERLWALSTAHAASRALEPSAEPGRGEDPSGTDTASAG